MRRYDIDRVDNRVPARIEWLARWLGPPLSRYFRAEVRGLDRIPDGAALYVGNHNAGLLTPDSFLFGAAVARERGVADVPFGLGHEVAISLPIVHQVIVPLGAVRASHETAHELFERGHKVIVYPGGDIDAMRPFPDRHRIRFGGRRGYVRLALREGVPILPVVAAGAHEALVILTDGAPLARLVGLDRMLRIGVCPVSLCLPWGLWIGPPLLYWPWPTRILIEILPPIRFERVGSAAAADEAYVAACADRVEGAMQAALDRLAEERRRRSPWRRLLGRAARAAAPASAPTRASGRWDDGGT
jgi:1-acyl-sn-glycerol-3-phosphate acyltransferase